MSTSIGSKEWLHLYSLGSNFLKCLCLRILCIILSCLKGNFKYKPGQARELGMLAGDSGITPMFQVRKCAFKKQELCLVYCHYWFFVMCFFPLLIKHFNDFKDLIYTSLYYWFQIIRAILENPKDKTKVHLIYASDTLVDMLLKVICLLQLFFSWDELETLVQ